MAERRPRRRSRPAEPKAEPEAQGGQEGVGSAGPGAPPPPPDEAPRPRGRRGPLSKAAQKEKDLAVIQSGLEELLVTMPGMAGVATGDRWLIDHVTNTGPPFAARLTAECERNETLRRLTLAALQGESVLMTAIAGFAYARPIAMHYALLPGGQAAGIPVRPRKGAQRRQAAQQAAAQQAAGEEAAQRAQTAQEAVAAAQAAAEAQGVAPSDFPPAFAVDVEDNVVAIPSDGDVPPAVAV